MVEFGLKLEDNKVSEWSEHYLDYVKLKAILKKAKGTLKKYEEQAKKRPEAAYIITEAYRNGVVDFVTNTPHTSTTNLAFENTTTEKTSLLANDPLSLQNKTDDQEGEKSQPGRATSPTSSYGAASYLSDYFGSRYENNLRGYLKEMELQEEEFETCLGQEVSKVHSFYHDKLDELKQRLELLVDNVADSYHIKTSLDIMDESKQQSTPQSTPGGGGDTRKRFMEMVSRVSTMITQETVMNAISVSKEDLSDDEGEDPPSTNLEDKAKVGEADSIKRALIDQYRTGKLLLNFVIMNYTGFVKIVKKFDKTIPEHKGRFKKSIEHKNLCDEGKDVELLTTKIEKYYANWFCEGDMQAAHARMLPKRGDGLEMDWTQLR
jgi:hypothetical protein